ncbi:MAG: hypothetical protein M3Z24_03205 [Chloroflexota bacterium]|nr:hypothetical protein [Chloroflexota bacterium]
MSKTPEAVVFCAYILFALFAYLVNTSAHRWATAAMVLTILGLALTLPALGVANYAFPAIGRAYLAGQPDVFGIVNSFFRFPMVVVFFPALYLAGLWPALRR